VYKVQSARLITQINTGHVAIRVSSHRAMALRTAFLRVTRVAARPRLLSSLAAGATPAPRLVPASVATLGPPRSPMGAAAGASAVASNAAPAVEVVSLYPHAEANHYEEALALRARVLWAGETPRPTFLDYEDADKRSTHFAALAEGRVVGVVSLDGARLRQLAVCPDFGVGRGVGAALVRAVADKCRLRVGSDGVLLVNAWRSSTPFYAKCGFLELGGEYDSVGVPCQKMYMPLRPPASESPLRARVAKHFRLRPDHAWPLAFEGHRTRC